MSNNAPDYNDNLVFPPEDDGIMSMPRCDIEDLKKENGRLRQALSECYKMAETWGATAELPTSIINICHKALNGGNNDSAN